MSSTEQKPQAVFSDAEYWKGCWDANNIGFHKTENNPTLVKHLDKLIQNRSNVTVFFPFCGKAVDMAWLASLGHNIVGIEYVEEAVRQFFSEQNIQFTVTEVKDYKLFTSEDKKIKIYNGDFFKFTNEYEPLFECIWDRGSYGALPIDLRIKYAEHMPKLLAPKFRYILEVFFYDPTIYPGPPHSVSAEEVKNSFNSTCQIELINEEEVKMSENRIFSLTAYLLTNH